MSNNHYNYDGLIIESDGLYQILPETQNVTIFISLPAAELLLSSTEDGEDKFLSTTGGGVNETEVIDGGLNYGYIEYGLEVQLLPSGENNNRFIKDLYHIAVPVSRVTTP